MRSLTSFTLVIAAVALSACGGSGEAMQADAVPADSYEQVLTQANESLAEARSLASTGPCSDTSQCSSLLLKSQVGPCPTTTVIDYSLASPTAAAASAAASRYDALQKRALALVTPPANTSGSCYEQVDATPLNCVANQCVRQFVFTLG